MPFAIGAFCPGDSARREADAEFFDGNAVSPGHDEVAKFVASNENH